MEEKTVHSMEANGENGDDDDMMGNIADALQMLPPVMEENADTSPAGSYIRDLSREYIGKSPGFTARIVFNHDNTLSFAIEGKKHNVRSWRCSRERFEYKYG